MPDSTQGETYTVQEGDTLPSIAAAKNYRSWEPIWEHEKNAALREERKDPGVLLAGDTIFIPPKEPARFDCETGRKHTFKLKELVAYLELVLEDEEGQPFANCPYEVTIDGGTKITGTTDGDGYFKQPISPKAKKAKVKVTPGDGRKELKWSLKLGHMDPAEKSTGAQAILNNLGYDAGDEDGQVDGKFKAALMEFQQDNDLEPTGELDEPTRAALKS